MPSSRSRLALALLLALPLRAAAEVSLAQTNEEAGGSWTAGDTELSRLPPEERLGYLGLVEPPDAPAVDPVVAPLAAPPPGGYPAAFDWRDNGGNFVTPVRDQAGCGACWAFAVAGALESKLLIAENTPGAALDLSEQVILSCSGAGTCAGGDLTGAGHFVTSTGTSEETCYPYLHVSGTCDGACAGWEDESVRSSTFWQDKYIPSTRDDPNMSARKELLKNIIYTKGPAVVAFLVYDDFYGYERGVYRKTASTNKVGGHAVVAVGWKDTSATGGYFIVKNSWGAGWGEKGFFRIAYDQLTSGPEGANFGYWIVSLGSAFRSSSAPLPDLMCTGQYLPDADAVVGDPLTLQGQIRNAGTADAPATTARLFLSSGNDADVGDDVDLGAVAVPPLAAGGSASVTWSFATPDLGPIPRQAWPVVVVDDGDTLAESNEHNVWKSVAPLLAVEPPVWLLVGKPNGGDLWRRGKTRAFTWGSRGCDQVTVQLLRRVDGRWRLKRTIAAGVDAAPGTLSWKVPDSFTTGSYYKARVRCDGDAALLDESDHRFTIK